MSKDLEALETCPTCGALPCDWVAGGCERANTVAALLEERAKDHDEINIKADCIDNMLNQLAEADQSLTEAADQLERYRVALETIARGNYDGFEVIHLRAPACRRIAHQALEAK